ncbi:hypothetical protein BCR35DRAFT_332315 [Leucosporidium creatinivorum]|uniref:Uncharacterized protein n=1 Tax=Leucosporidium creatinivorum TaxID=106004 RepID=A0A1Y2F4M6_9BASI|nr:hypothetical protein BCR35DRAFT_332315 [Leucosporidium creatinivorum]
MSSPPPGFPPPGAVPPPNTIPGYVLAFHLPESIYFSTVASFVLVGVIFSLSITYISRYGLARGRIELANKLLVAVMVACCFAKFGLDTKRIYDAVARTGENPFDGELTAELVMIFVPTVLAQTWLLYRLWAVSRHNIPATALGLVVVLTSIITYTGFLIRQTTTSLLPFLVEPLREWFLAYSITNAVADIYLSTAFITSVFILRKRAISRRIARSFSLVLGVAVQAFVFTAFCSIGMLIFVAFQTLLPELNTISVLYTLNSRKRTSLDAQPVSQPSGFGSALDTEAPQQEIRTMVQSQTESGVASPSASIPRSVEEATMVVPAGRPKFSLAEVIIEENLRDSARELVGVDVEQGGPMGSTEEGE